MTITDKIKSALGELNIPYYFITRGNNTAPCIVYNYFENPNCFADNEEKSSKYTILFNLYCLNDVEKTKRLVVEKLEMNGFVKASIQSTMLDDTGFFNTPIQMKISLRRNIDEVN